MHILDLQSRAFVVAFFYYLVENWTQNCSCLLCQQACLSVCQPEFICTRSMCLQPACLCASLSSSVPAQYVSLCRATMSNKYIFSVCLQVRFLGSVVCWLSCVAQRLASVLCLLQGRWPGFRALSRLHCSYRNYPTLLLRSRVRATMLVPTAYRVCATMLTPAAYSVRATMLTPAAYSVHAKMLTPPPRGEGGGGRRVNAITAMTFL